MTFSPNLRNSQNYHATMAQTSRKNLFYANQYYVGGYNIRIWTLYDQKTMTVEFLNIQYPSKFHANLPQSANHQITYPGWRGV